MPSINEVIEAIFEFNGELIDIRVDEVCYNGIVVLNCESETVDIWAHFKKLLHVIEVVEIVSISVENEYLYNKHNEKLTYGKFLKIIKEK